MKLMLMITIFFAVIGGVLIHISWISFIALFVIKVFKLSDFKIEWFDWGLLNVSVFMTPIYILIVGIIFIMISMFISLKNTKA